VALAFGGYGILEGTGASKRIVAPVAVITLAGLGLAAGTWLADVYGVLSPSLGVGVPVRQLFPLEVELGLRYVADAVLDRGAFTVLGLSWAFGRGRLAPRVMAAVGEDELLVELPAAYRFYGPRTDRPALDGTFLELVPSMRHHRLGNAALSITSFELELAGRLDLGRLVSGLTGSFAELSTGVALATHHYFERGLDPATLLLFRFGWGFYVGAPGGLWGEFSVAYDHRHDLLVSGLKLPGTSSGVFGHGVASGTLYLKEGLGLRLEVAAGSTILGGASLVYRFGGAE
jgi:hypothetical protein